MAHKQTSKTVFGDFNPTNPPYAIDNQLNHEPLDTKTLSADAVHSGGLLEYFVHNLFGLMEAQVCDPQCV